MKKLVVISLTIIFYSNLFSQSLPASSYPPAETRPAFLLEEQFDVDSDYPQKDLLKSYLKYYLYKKAYRYTYVEALELQFDSLSTFYKRSFNQFKFLKNKRAPKIENDLAFENQAYDFANFLSYDFGFCMGVTSVIRKFNMLAHFDPSNKYKQKVPLRQVDEQKWQEFYHKIIDRIMSNKPTVIPRFKNLEDFSQYGMFYTYLQRHAIDQWALNNLSLRAGVSDMLFSVHSRPSRYSNYMLYHKLKSRLALHYNPKVFLSKPGSVRETSDIWIHVVQVYKLSAMKADGSYTIHVWDPNFPASHEYSKGIIKIAKGGKAFFMSEPEDDSEQRVPHTLSRVDLYKFDDAEVMEILNNYEPFCKKYPQICQ